MVRFARILPADAERIWKLLTEPALLPQWFGESVMEPRVGGAVCLMGGQVRGVVTQWLPLRRLAHTWNVFGPGEDESAYPESYLTFDLEQRDEQIHVVLTHLPVLERFEKQNAMGWHTFLDLVGSAALGEAPPPLEGVMTRNALLYEIDMNNLAR